MRILVTGGAGYIGSHTILELIEAGYKDLISIDNFANSTKSTFDRIESISGVRIKNYKIDLKDKNSLTDFFAKEEIDGIIHFAALKSVPESILNPEVYYDNNINSFINILSCAHNHGIRKIIFSSSCSVYGNSKEIQVTEDSPFGIAESPYALTKQIGEMLLENNCKIYPDLMGTSLRYFNPAGAHSSSKIGELSTQLPNNLVPIIAQQAAGVRDSFQVFGNDYNTRDGSCIRDYVHVSDIAKAHVNALNQLENHNNNYNIFNLGSGQGLTTLEVINAFEKANDIKLNYVISDRRKGDVEAIYANCDRAKEELDWSIENDIEVIVKSAWNWQKELLHQ